ncbi:hypothetical protein LCGC14_0413850 [marine sediment metagenome]|uniref:Adenylosuccinate synthetase n=1 Tax=marine sediment metagenome TaxID=412755 RepID=A0A0F9SYT9_9ZZZZ
MKLTMVIDCQFGSTGKGKVADYLLNGERKFEAGICDFGPNAGHTIYHPLRGKIVLKQLPVACLHRLPCFIGPGAVIDPVRLCEEIQEHDAEVYIHPNAMILKSHHKEWEQENLVYLSSTGQGVGAAVASKIRRERGTVLAGEDEVLSQFTFLYHHRWKLLLNSDAHVLGESAQGYGLSIDSQFYPYTTSRNVNVPAVLDRFGGVHPSHLYETVGVYRTYPIRVGNWEKDGVCGWSGAVYDDQKELNWEDLGVKSEITTVTNRVRRVFTWSAEMYKETLDIIKPDVVVINFMDYVEKRLWEDWLETNVIRSGIKVIASDGPGPNDFWEVTV